MNYIHTYKNMYTSMLGEHRKVFEKLDMDQLKNLIDAIVDANKIFVVGAGREGISLRGFAMRLAHLGKDVHWLWDDTTVGMGEGDLFIITQGSGDVGMFRYIMEKAAKTGARIFACTGRPEGESVKTYAHDILFIHSTVYMGGHSDDVRQADVVPTMQPMGNQYEQHLYLLTDIIAVLVKDALGQTYDDMEARHRNIE